MVRNPELLERMELEYEREHPLTLKQKFDLFEEMYQHAVQLGRFPLNRAENSLEDIVSLAKALHADVPKASHAHRKGAGER